MLEVACWVVGWRVHNCLYLLIDLLVFHGGSGCSGRACVRGL